MTKKNAVQAVEDDALPVDKTVQAVEDSQKIEVKPDELETLKQQLVAREKEIVDERVKSETASKELEAERRKRDEYAQKYNQESAERFKYQGDSIESRIEAKKADISRIEREINDAAEKGQFTEMAKLSAKLAKTELEIEIFSNQKATIEQAKRIPLEKPRTPTDLWVENHPEFVTDESYKAIAIAAHHKAMRQGIKLESQEYFQFVEKNLDKDYYNKAEVTERQEQEFDDADIDNNEILEQPKITQPRKVQSTPPSRSGAGSSSGPGKRVTLTPEEVAFALDTYGRTMSAADAKLAYWEAKQEGIKNGHIQ